MCLGIYCLLLVALKALTDIYIYVPLLLEFVLPQLKLCFLFQIPLIKSISHFGSGLH